MPIRIRSRWSSSTWARVRSVPASWAAADISHGEAASGWIAQGLDGGGQHVVVADEDDQLDPLRGRRGCAQLAPGGVVDVLRRSRS